MVPLIAILVVILLGLILFLIMRNRRRANANDVLPPPELSDPVDYTSLPYEEPTTWSDRLRKASPATKALLFLLPLALIVILAIVYFGFFQSGPPTSTATPEPSSLAITNVSAIVAKSDGTQIKADAKTNLPDGTTVVGTMRENGKDFSWNNADTSIGKVRDGSISILLNKAAKAPVPQQGREYSVILSATVNNQKVSSTPTRLEIPTLAQAGFFQLTVAAASVEPTQAATSTPEPTNPPATATPMPSATQTPKPKQGSTFTTTVFNGGNIRQVPNLQGSVLGQLNAGEVVTLLERTSDGSWYHVDAPAAEGWVSVTLLNAISPAVVRQVPVLGQNGQSSPQPTVVPGLTGTVFNGGNVRAAPNLQGKVLDQINAYETVTLLQKTRDGAWYRITDKRNVEGWVNVTLLTIDANVVRQVPIAP